MIKTSHGLTDSLLAAVTSITSQSEKLEPVVPTVGLLKGLEEMAGRGRPRIHPIKPKVKKAGDDDDGEEDYGPDTGPEADQNIVVHLKKVVDTDGKHHVKFQDGKSHKVHPDVAKKVLTALGKLKPQDRLKVQAHINQSHSNLIGLHKDFHEEVEHVDEQSVNYDPPYKKSVKRNVDFGKSKSEADGKYKVTAADRKEMSQHRITRLKKVGEEVEQVDELKKATLASYVNKAALSAADSYGKKRAGEAGADEIDRFTNRLGAIGDMKHRESLKKMSGVDQDSLNKHHTKTSLRLRGIKRATARLAKEVKRRNLGERNLILKAAGALGRVAGKIPGVANAAKKELDRMDAKKAAGQSASADLVAYARAQQDKLHKQRNEETI